MRFARRIYASKDSEDAGCARMIPANACFDGAQLSLTEQIAKLAPLEEDAHSDGGCWCRCVPAAPI